MTVDDNYDLSLSRDVTNEEIDKMLETLSEYRESSYNLFTHNCGNFAVDVTASIDPNVDDSRKNMIPNIQYINIAKTTQDSWEQLSMGECTDSEIGLLSIYYGITSKPLRNVVRPLGE